MASVESEQIKKKIISRNDLYFKIIQNRLSELLKIINSKYSGKFPKNLINQELEYIMTNINLMEPLPPIQSDSSRNKLQVNNKDTQIKSNARFKPKQKVELADRCQARIWDDIFDRATFKQATSIDDEFQVSDFNDINIKKFNKKYILGKQCSRKKTTTTNYCLLHNRHRPHGNYFEQPSKELCLHFMTDGGYLESIDSDD